jgi:hypothetical protein
MLKSSNFRRNLRGQPREGVVHGPNPCTPFYKSPSLPPTYLLPPPFFLLPPRPRGRKEEGGRKERKGRGRGRRGGVSGGKGGPGFHPAPPFPCPSLSLPHHWAGPPNFGASVVFTARPAQNKNKPSGQHNFFSPIPN